MVRRTLFAFAVVCVAILFVPAAAGASPRVVNGPCEGSGAFETGGFTVTAAETGIVTVPAKDTVHWQGSIKPNESGEQPYSGAIRVELPPPFSSIDIDSWSGTSDSTQNSGVKKYDLPSFVPKGVELRVSGFHDQGSAKCDGFVRIKIDGSKFGVASVGSLVLTALTGAGLLFAGRAKGGV
jgi:hypothetical protein